MQPLFQWKKSIKYYTTWVCVFVALVNQFAMCLHHIIWGLLRSTLFSYCFRKKSY